MQKNLKTTPLTAEHVADGVMYLLSTPPEVLVWKSLKCVTD